MLLLAMHINTLVQNRHHSPTPTFMTSVNIIFYFNGCNTLKLQGFKDIHYFLDCQTFYHLFTLHNPCAPQIDQHDWNRKGETLGGQVCYLPSRQECHLGKSVSLFGARLIIGQVTNLPSQHLSQNSRNTFILSMHLTE